VRAGCATHTVNAVKIIRFQSARRRLALATALALALAACGGGGSSTPAPTPNPVPSLTSISPSTATAGGGSFTLTATGSNFISGSVIRFAGSNRTTTFVSSTQLTAQITQSDISDGGTVQVTVFNPPPGGGTSAAQTFTISNPSPTLTSIGPSSAVATGLVFILYAHGSGFVPSSVLRWNGVDRTTTFGSSTLLTTQITQSDISDGGTVQVTVFNPPPGGGTSAAQTLTINNPSPTLTSLSPSSAVATGQEFTLHALGSGFVPSSVVRWNASDRATTLVSSTEVTATILASDIATTGTAQVTVFNPTPGGGLSSSQAFTITTASSLVFNTSRLPDTTTGKSYNFGLSASGGVPNPDDSTQPYIWTIASGSLPASLTLDPGTGRILGTVSGSTSTFTVRVSDYAATPATQTQSLTLQVLPSLGLNDFCTPGSTAGTTQISNGTIRASLSPYGDVDVYSFQGTAGHQVTIETFAQRLDLDGNPATRDSQADTILELLDGNCSRLTYNDDIVMGDMQDSLIQNFTLPSTGLYFLSVRDFRGDGRPDLIYELSLSGAD
jgi:hypothetical protein